MAPASAVLTVAVLLAGCGGASPPSKSAVVSQLEKDPDFSTLKDAVQSDQYQAFVGCVADFLLKKGQASDLEEYVKGKRSLQDVRGFASDSDSQATAKQCATQAGIVVQTSPSADTSSSQPAPSPTVATSATPEAPQTPTGSTSG